MPVVIGSGEEFTSYKPAASGVRFGVTECKLHVGIALFDAGGETIAHITVPINDWLAMLEAVKHDIEG